ncbi:MAG TPA: DoxX family protein [Pedobacter sp.]|jgi:hypothetical protein
MSSLIKESAFSEWKGYQKTALQFFLFFFSLLTIPLDIKFYKFLFSGSWLDFHITDLLAIASYLPNFFSENDTSPWGLASFSTWGLVLAIALAASFAWTAYERRTNQSLVDYNKLYYWLRAVLRYRLGIALIAYGLIKIFPLQMPLPSLSNLHTNYGDFLPWKIYFHTVGVAPNYETFFGVVEVLAGVLLFFRNKVSFGAGIVLGFAGNIVAANFAYNIGSHVLSTYLVLIATFLFAHDVPRLFNLLALEKPTKAERYEPDFTDSRLKKAKFYLKGFAYLFVAALALSSFINYQSDPYLIPQKAGLSGAYGFYNVKHFVFNNDTIPYSRTDLNRWQNVVFEKWSTISIKTAKPVKLDFSVRHASQLNDIDRVYESAGVGDRRYFDYTIDSSSKSLSLLNKNPHHRDEKFNLNYQRLNDSTIVLTGVNENNDKITAYLERIDRKYMLIEGRRKPVKL